MAIPLIPTLAITTAAAAYLDGKYQIRQDVHTFLEQRVAAAAVAQMVRTKRTSQWYSFEDAIAKMPGDEECIWSRDGCYSWRETYDQSCRYGDFLQAVGVQRGDIVATMLTNRPEFVFHWMGCLSVGSAPAFINYQLAGDTLLHCIKVSGANLLVVDWDADVRQRINDIRIPLEDGLGIKIVVLDEATRASINLFTAKPPDENLTRSVGLKDPMCLLYTSGSTGFPKAVSFSMSRAAWLAGGRIRNTGIRPGPGGDRYYICMPLYHGTGGATMAAALMGGVPVCIGKKFSTSKFWDDVRDSRSTAFVYVGETVRYLLSAPSSPRDKDHEVRVAFGNGLRPDVWRRFKTRFNIETITEFFNSTEGVFALSNISRGPFSEAAVGHNGGLSRLLLRNVFVAAEIDYDSGELYRDPKTGLGRRRPLHDGGEILVAVSSEDAFPGYWQDDAATKKKFVRDLFKRGDLYYRSGDALRRDVDGRWFFIDRLGDTFRWKSENVATAEVSERLGLFPGINEAVVYGVEVPSHEGRAGCAAISLAPQTAPDAAFFRALLAYSKKHLPPYAVPVFIRLQVNGSTAMHNQKQNKMPLRKDGIDLDMIYGECKTVSDAQAAGRDIMYWWPYALGCPSDDGNNGSYVTFARKDWIGLQRKSGNSSK